MSQRILEMSPRSNARTSSSRTSRQSSEDRVSPPIADLPAGAEENESDSQQHNADRPTILELPPPATVAARASLSESEKTPEEVSLLQSSVPRSRRTSRSFFRLGAVSSIVGSPSFFNYCSPPQNGAAKDSVVDRRAAAGSNVDSLTALDLPNGVSTPVVPSSFALNSTLPGDLTSYSLARVVSWNTDEVVQWLRSFDAPSAVVEAFKTHEVTGSTLLTSISRESLKRDIGIFPFGYRAKVMEHLKLLK